MAERAGNRKAIGTFQEYSSFDEEHYGRRMQLLLKAGGDRYLKDAPDTLIALASSSKSDNDMLDTFLDAHTQVDFNMMKEKMEAMPHQLQEAEFNSLPVATQNVLLNAGYEIPDASRDALWKRMLTWDIPLLPEEHFGSAVKWGMAPIRAVGFVAGKATSTLWEKAVMEPSRFATRLGRTGAYLTQRYGGIASWDPLAGAQMGNPAKWREAWNATKRQNDSFYAGTLEKSIELVGKEQTNLLRAYLADGQQGVYELILNQAQGDERTAQARFEAWQSTLDNQNSLDALQVLETGKLTLFDASIRGFNAVSPYDVSPNSLGGKIVGSIGALSIEILLDPMTWVGGAYVKIYKAIKSGVRGSEYTKNLIDLQRRIAMTVRTEDRIWKTIRGGRGGQLFKDLKVWNPTTGTFSDPTDEIADWIKQPKKARDAAATIDGIPVFQPLRDLWQSAAVRIGTSPLVLRAQGHAHNRFIDRVTDAFTELDAQQLAEMQFKKTEAYLDGSKTWKQKQAELIDAGEFNVVDPIGQLLRDVPGLRSIMPDMLRHHMMRRKMNLVVDQAYINENGYFEIIDDFTGEIISQADISGFHHVPDSGVYGKKFSPTDEGWIVWDDILKDPIEMKGMTNRSFPTLADHEGYWEFLESAEGMKGLASSLGGVDPEAMWIPAISAFGEQWIKTKRWVRNTQDFYKVDLEAKADMARLTAQFLVKQGNYVHKKVWEGIEEGAIQLSKDIDELDLDRLLKDPRLTDKAELSHSYDELGLNHDDYQQIQDAVEIFEAEAPLFILEDAEMSDLYHWYEADGWHFQKNPDTGVLELTVKKPPAFKKTKDLYKRKRKELEDKYFDSKIHGAGSQNGELDWLTRTGIITRSTATALMYHPAKFAEKLTTYVPKARHLDLTDPNLGLQEFQALVDMGVMADMPRTQIDHFFRDYVLGNEADRWRVTTEFYLDFLGRSGAILMGGSDVTKFIERFVRHGYHKYGQVAEDFVGLHGLNVRVAVHPSQEHLAQFAKANVIPDYRELAAVSRYMSMYRRLGWGLPLPQIDKFIARAWRPAVLLRLGYVARNGGEELATWWWREGPTNYLKQKMARKAVDMHPVWDEYGRRVMMKGTDKLADGQTVADAVRAPLFWRPFSRLWRSFNEFAGVGDYAITTRAIKESIEAKPYKWQFMTEDQRVQVFKQVRAGIEKDIKAKKWYSPSKTSKSLFEFADSKANEFSLLLDNVRDKIPGLPSKHKLAEKIGRAVDIDHDKRVDAIIRTYTHPTILDAQMKDILGGFDNYLNYSKNTLDDALRQTGVDNPINNLVQMAMVGVRENTDLKYISTIDSSSVHGVPKSVAVAQRLDMISGDKAARRFIQEAMHHVPISTREKLRHLSEQLLIADLDLAHLVTANPEVIVLTALRKDRTSFDKLSKAYNNIIPEEAIDETGELISSVISGDMAYIDAVDEFIASRAGEEQWIWDMLLNPKDAAGVEIGADWNLMAFLLSDPDQLDIAKLTDNFDEAIDRGMKAYVSYLSGTPEGQQFVMSSHRGSAGGRAKGRMDLPLPPGMSRLFMPMIPVRLAQKYTDILRPGGGLSKEWFNTFVDLLGQRLTTIGISADEATKAARLLHPGNVGETLSAQVALMEEWAQTGNYFPIVVGSADDRVASAISETLIDMLDDGIVTASDVATGSARGMIGSLDVNSESLFNQGGFASHSRPEFRTTVTRNGVKGTTEYKTLAEDISGEYWNDFFGFEGARDPITGEATGRGVIGAKEFGEGGLKNETMIGVGGTHLLSPKPGGFTPIHMLDGQSQVGTVKIYKDKTGRFILLEEGTEVDPDAVDWFANAELVEEQRVPMNGIRATAEEYALLAKQELIDLLSSGSRRGVGQEEWFYPWIRETISGEPVSAHRVHRAATDGRWWPHAPKDILAFVPVTNEGGGIGEKISDAWTTILRNWFDGVVNPMIGAMVREPMFQHYLMVGWDQTIGVRRNFDRAKRDVISKETITNTKIKGRRQYDKGNIFVEGPNGKTKIGTYEYRSQFAEEDLHYIITGDETDNIFDEFGQYDQQPFTDFAEIDWQLAHTDPDDVMTQIAFALEARDPEALAIAIRQANMNSPEWDGVERLMSMKRKDINGIDIRISMRPTRDAKGNITFARKRKVAGVQDDFFNMMHHKKRVFETHRDVATQRAMTLTSAYIDDHRIRSQFQQMVGTMVPFWFAEDNFLRRVGRSLKHNPLMLRNLHLTMTAGVYSGLVQTDEFGERKLIIPGSEVATTAMLAIADSTPIVKNVFGGELGSVIRPSMGLATSLKVIPGYDLETIGRMGFGPLLATPINYLSGRDPEIRKMFEANLIGGRYRGVSEVSSNAESLWKATWSSFMPAILTRSLQIANIDGPEGEARNKAKIDVLKFLAMQDKIPTEQEIASADNPALFQEAFLEKVDAMAKQYQLLQAMTWFFGTGTGYLADITLNENWEWNSEFYDLLELGMPYEEAYPQWVKNIEARTGEDFNAMQFSPFRTSAYEKIPFAVLETTQDANRWLVDNDEFTRSFKMASPFFMPRDFDPEDDEYVAEAKQRQVNIGLRSLRTPEEFLESLYFNVSYGVYSQHRVRYLKQKEALKSAGMDTKEVQDKWDIWLESFKSQHPVFNHSITTGTSRLRREETIHQFRLILETPELAPEGLHKEDVLTAMATIVGFQDKMDALRGLTTPDAQAKRDALRAQYFRVLESFSNNKPWLNELFYSVFVPLIGESWLAKYDGGNININTGVLV